MSTVLSTSSEQVGPPRGLQYVFVISRHGQRTPVDASRNLLKNVVEGYGELTEEGRQQAFKLGQFIRARYIDFLQDADNNPEQLLATHVGLSRCRDSVKETLRGLGISVCEVKVDPTAYDKPFFASVEDNIDAVEREPCQGHFSTLGELISFIAEKAGMAVKTKRDKFLVVDNLMTHVLNGNPVPDWSKPFWDDIRWADRKIFQRTFQGHELSFARYVLGRVLETFSLKFEQGVERPDKMHLYSMSDTSVSSLLRLFSRSYDGRPCFCASVFFEVYKDGSEYYVRVLFRTEDNPNLVALDELENPCEMTKFLKCLRGVLKPT
uniref:acid phosphatase n=1 Tax=Amblyomma maculatum TaxID=34609 RepID=G3MSZ8_AMBMU